MQKMDQYCCKINLGLNSVDFDVFESIFLLQKLLASVQNFTTIEIFYSRLCDFIQFWPKDCG